jgi:ribosomal protein L24E
MELQERYIVIKYKDLCHYSTSNHHGGDGSLFVKYLTDKQIATLFYLCNKITESRIKRGKKELQALVIEKDWPEYEQSLALLSARVDAEGSNVM